MFLFSWYKQPVYFVSSDLINYWSYLTGDEDCGSSTLQPHTMGPDQESYLDQVDLYLTDKQSIGATTYSLLCDLLAPEAKTKFASGRNICCTMEALRTDTSGDRRTFSFSKKGSSPWRIFSRIRCSSTQAGNTLQFWGVSPTWPFRCRTPKRSKTRAMKIAQERATPERSRPATQNI